MNNFTLHVAGWNNKMFNYERSFSEFNPAGGFSNFYIVQFYFRLNREEYFQRFEQF